MGQFLNSIPSPAINTINAGPFQIRFYALFIIVGIVVAIWISAARLKARGGSSGAAVDIAIWAVPFGIVGGRIFHVLTHFTDYFGAGKNPLEALYIWQGGLAIYGALILGAVGAYIGCRQAGIRFMSYLDALAPGLLLAQAIGRWGNYFNNELFGVPTDLPWGLEISADNPAYPVGLPAGESFHPAFLYESLWSVLGVFLILWVDRKFQPRWGRLFGMYLVYYSFGRIFIESIRIDPSAIILGLRTNVWSAILGVVLGLVILWVQARKHPGLESSVYLSGREPEIVPEPREDADEVKSEG
ncbi:MAG: prolipoprotein diacylglyceryl transferase [Micrococcales bacterium]